MSRKFSLNTLTEGIRQRHLGQQNSRLLEKWSRTGLLRGLDGQKRENMSMLLENQAAQALRESSTIGAGGGAGTASGDLGGFTNIAFPIVRRVFGGLVANELVSIQPMSLPSGLLFYLDYTYGSVNGSAQSDNDVYTSGSSIYGNPSGKSLQTGAAQAGGMYDLAGSGYSRVYQEAGAINLITSGAFKGTSAMVATAVLDATGSDGALIQFDPALTTLIEGVKGAGATADSYSAVVVKANTIQASSNQPVDFTAIKEIGLFAPGDTTPYGPVSSDLQGQGKGLINVRRLNQLVRVSPSGATGASVTGITPISTITDPTGDADVGVLFIVSGTQTAATAATLKLQYVQDPNFTSSSGETLVIPTFESNFGATPSPEIPEIDIKIESIPVVADTRKLRAKWSPELAQDLNAYHSLDAEVELTQILSAQIALEIDREILNDLLQGAAGANFFWSRSPGNFVDKTTGVEAFRSSTLASGPAFTGTVREWYETLIETIIDVGNTIHRKTLRGAANFIVVGPDVATILEASVYYRPSLSIDGDGQVATPFSLGAEKVGTLSNRFTVYKDPYFPRNKILVGYKGGSYLETGYVYAPYVPLIITPTIFAPEDFTPRKGVMTRYGKKLVRADFYGTVTCLKMNII
ncbi:MAG: hypothetical protein CMA72_09345 [Euryarchaeota archaeon]|nr:hypothetical protein [Euryarchaeota archaeon]|tara:strand:- start:743 stop:2650 length:1908 start_codon:yes stop_codon:yes gene_type:complete